MSGLSPKALGDRQTLNAISVGDGQNPFQDPDPTTASDAFELENYGYAPNLTSTTNDTRASIEDTRATAEVTEPIATPADLEMQDTESSGPGTSKRLLGRLWKSTRSYLPFGPQDEETEAARIIKRYDIQRLEDAKRTVSALTSNGTRQRTELSDPERKELKDTEASIKSWEKGKETLLSRSRRPDFRGLEFMDEELANAMMAYSGENISRHNVNMGWASASAASAFFALYGWYVTDAISSRC